MKIRYLKYCPDRDGHCQDSIDAVIIRAEQRERAYAAEYKICVYGIKEIQYSGARIFNVLVIKPRYNFFDHRDLSLLGYYRSHL